jgi:hypothetical protein
MHFTKIIITNIISLMMRNSHQLYLFSQLKCAFLIYELLKWALISQATAIKHSKMSLLCYWQILRAMTIIFIECENESARKNFKLIINVTGYFSTSCFISKLMTLLMEIITQRIR